MTDRQRRVVVEMLATITAPRTEQQPGFCAGVVLWDDRVTAAAPVLRYMKTWTRDRVRAHCNSKGWTIEVVTESKRTVG